MMSYLNYCVDIKYSSDISDLLLREAQKFAFLKGDLSLNIKDKNISFSLE